MDEKHLTSFVMSDTILKIKINNNQPVELLELTKSMLALANQYNRYVDKNAEFAAERESKLLVNEVKTGCIEFDLIELVSVSIIPFMDNTNTIIGFAKLVKDIFDYLLRGSTEDAKEPPLDVSDLKDMSGFVSMVANDSGSNTTISTVVNGNVSFTFNIDSTNANAFQNIAKKKIEQLTGVEDTGIRKNVLFTWYQARRPSKKEEARGNKGIIEDISKKSMNVFFDNDTIKDEMINTDINIFKMGFVVDVKPQEARGRLVAYKITKVHERFEID